MVTKAASDDNDQNGTLDEEAKQLKLELIKADARRAIAEAEKATLDAQFPAHDIKPPEGKVEVGEKVGMIAEFVAYSLLEDAAKEIACEIGESTAVNSIIFIVEDRNLTSKDWQYEIICKQIKYHNDLIIKASEMIDKLKLATYTGYEASLIIGSLANLAGMFRSNYSIESREVQIGETPVVAAMSNAISNLKGPNDEDKGLKVIVDGFQLFSKTKIYEEYENVCKKRIELDHKTLHLKNYIAPKESRIKWLQDERKSAGLEYVKVLATSNDATNLKEHIKKLEEEIKTSVKEIASSRELIGIAEDIGARFDTFASAITKALQGNSYPPLVAAAIREQLHKNPPGSAEKATHVLHIAVEAGSGEIITRQWLWGKSGKVGFLGGFQISYLLLEINSGKIMSSGSKVFLGHLKYNLAHNTATKPTRVGKQ